MLSTLPTTAAAAVLRRRLLLPRQFSTCSERDRLVIRQLSLSPSLRGSFWAQSELSPSHIVLDLDLAYDSTLSAPTDDLGLAISYSELAQNLRTLATSRTWPALSTLGHALVSESLNLANKSLYKKHQLEKQKSLTSSTLSSSSSLTNQLLVRLQHTSCILGASKAGIELHLNTSPSMVQDSIASNTTTCLFIEELKIDTIIGVLEQERIDPQPVLVDLRGTLRSDCPDETSDLLRKCSSIIKNHLASSHPELLETLVNSTANLLLETNAFTEITLDIRKPSVVPFAQGGAGVSVTRKCPLPAPGSTANKSSNTIAASDIQQEQEQECTTLGSPYSPYSDQLPNTAIIAIGSNIGDRAKYLDQALNYLDNQYSDDIHSFSKLITTSLLYESEPMYVTEQDRFLNGVCKIATSLSPNDLLKKLKEIETTMGRNQKGLVNGPRVIDLDILFYNDISFNDQTNDLTIPHKSMLEREFVLRPLADVVPDYRHPSHSMTISQSLACLMDHEKGKSQLHKVVPLLTRENQVIDMDSSTHIMSILNVTPDSFSDGGEATTVQFALQKAKTHLEQGATIIDIGGMSTRPNASDISPEEESSRIVPVIKAIREEGIQAPISVDTFRASVAVDAINAGADIINDISGGMLDQDMVSTCAKLNVPVILMHMRGTPWTMTSLTNYQDDNVMKGVIDELSDRVNEALKAGVKPWNIIIDPGLGFAKDTQGNVDLLSYMEQFRDVSNAKTLAKYPLLVGASRKRFLGALTGRSSAKDRDYATAAVTTASIAQGASIIRVHDVPGNVDAARVADAIYKRCMPPQINQ